MEWCKKNSIEDDKPWTKEDQSELERLDSGKIQICDTEIWRQTNKAVDITLDVLQKFQNINKEF